MKQFVAFAHGWLALPLMSAYIFMQQRKKKHFFYAQQDITKMGFEPDSGQ